MAEIVSLRGGDVLTPPGDVCEAVVTIARDILERALAGDINGLAVSMRNSDGAHTYRLGGEATIATVGNIELMKFDLLSQIG